MVKDQLQDMDDISSDEMIVRKKKVAEKKTGVTASFVLKTAAEALAALREKRPLVHCITGHVAAHFSANALLALGGSSAMVEDMSEITPFVKMADALLVNTGTVTKPQTEAMRAAVSHANLNGKPWVLDPVAVGLLPLRTFIAKELMRRFPAMIRGNASEILFLAGNEDSICRGAESTASSDETLVQATRLAGVTRAAVLVTGPTDYVAGEGAPVVSISNGSPMMSRVAGIGSAQGLFGAAFLGTLGSKARWEATLATALVTAIAGEMAAAKASAPGSYQIAFLDALSAIRPEDIVKRGKVKVIGDKQ